MQAIENYQNWIILALIVAGLLLFGWIMIRTFGGKVRARRGARLGISEYYEVDKSRFLVLVRRDDVEHLVLVGGNQDVVIETNIRPDAQLRPAAEPPRRILTADDVDDLPDLGAPRAAHTRDADPSLGGNVRPMAPRPAPRPPVFGDAQAPAGEPRAPSLRAVEREPE